ncbi:MAG: hypothetical protein D6696_15120 [Acidobacteria bacterium]|nr:MAG: hypothetical protein D6696_15120 [Acidobacteriota bacterium]
MLVLALASSAAGAPPDGNWPAWRGDGSGVSADAGLPERWSAEENVRWRRRLPGSGHSSPIVWGERVFVTYVSDRVPRRAVQALLSPRLRWLLAAVAILWCLGTFFRHPADPHRPPKEAARGPGAGRTLVLAVLYAGATSAAYYLLWRHVPLLGVNLFRDLFAWALSGLAGAGAVYVVQRLADRRWTLAGGGPPWRRLAAAAWAGFRFAAVASFLAAAVAVTLELKRTDFPIYTDEGPWLLSSLISCLGLIAAAAAFPPRSRGRLVVVLLSLPGLAVLLWGPPSDPGAWLRTDARDRYLALYAVTVASLVYLGFGERRRRTAQRGLLAAAGPAALLLLALIQLASEPFTFIPKVVIYRVLALDRAGGETAWDVTCRVVPEPKLDFRNTAATPTPATDGERVYAYFGNGGVCGLDFDGRLLWHSPGPTTVMDHGAGSSLVLWRDRLIVTHDSYHEWLTYALDAASGEKVWEVRRRRPPDPPGDDAYGTPIVVPTAGGDQLVHSSTASVTGYDPATGAELWSRPQLGAQVVASPVGWRDLVIVTTGRERRYGRAEMSALRLTADGDAAAGDAVWRADKMLPDVSSPVVYGDHVYAVTNGGVVTCRSAATGELAWRTRLPSSTYYAAATAGDGKIYFSNMDGQTVVLAADPAAPRILAINDLEEPISASPAISRRQLFIRTHRHLYCIAAP